MQQLLHQFYTLLPRDERQQCLQQLLASGELTDACDAQLQTLWQLRYGQKRLLRTLPDAFLNALMDLLYLDSQQQSGIGLRRLQKELQKTAGALGLDRFAGASLEEQALFLAEWQNCAAYFAHLGQEDRAYNSGILHLRPLPEQALAEKLLRDFRVMARTLPQAADLQALFSPLAEALHAAFCAQYPQWASSADVLVPDAAANSSNQPN